MRVAAILSDLILFSRIDSAADAAGQPLIRVDTPADLPSGLNLVLVDWSARQPGWAEALAAIRDSGASVLLFGPHTDLRAHAEARAAGLGPMWARSKLVGQLRDLLDA